jgi:surface protein
MFQNARSLTTLDLSNFNTENVTTMQSMFDGASSLIALNLSNFNTENVTTMHSLFRDLTQITGIEGLENFNTSNVTTMQDMFYNTQSLTTLDLSSFDTSNVTTMGTMFLNARSLTTLDLSSFDTSNVTNMGAMFQNARSLTTLDLSNFNTENAMTMRSMFDGASSLTALDLSNFNTENVTTMRNMFNGAGSLTSLDLSHFDTSNVTDMGEMFNRAISVTDLNLSGWNLLNVRNMRHMFYHARSLTNLDLSGWDTKNVTDMGHMFQETALTSLDLSSWDTGNVRYMDWMFMNARNLTSLNLFGWNTGSLITMHDMFRGAGSLTALDLSSFNTSNVTDMNNIFAGTYALRQLALGKHFHFVNPPAPALPLAPITGRWQNVGNGTVSNPQGEHILTAAQLMATYDGATMADTWTWERRVFPVDSVIKEFWGFSAQQPPQNLLRDDGNGVLDTIIYNGQPITFEMVLDIPDGAIISEVNLHTVMQDGSRGEIFEMKPRIGDNSRWFDVDSHPNVNLYVSGMIEVEIFYQFRTESNIETIIANAIAPETINPSMFRDSLLMPNEAIGDGLTTSAYSRPPSFGPPTVPSPIIGPNSGRHELAPGFILHTGRGNQRWTIETTEDAVGKTFIFWAHANGQWDEIDEIQVGPNEIIIATVNKSGRFLIGNDRGMNHFRFYTSIDGIVVKSEKTNGLFRFIIDPSGNVYEAVPSNRLEGVIATIFKEGESQPWNAADYNQKNPLTTDRTGFYAWDVPTGKWRVRYEKLGFETAHSISMPVPPEHTEVHIGLVSKRTPKVEHVNAFPTGIEIYFDKYMNADNLIPVNFTVTQNDEEISGQIVLLNRESNFLPYDYLHGTIQANGLPSARNKPREFASVVRFVPSQELSDAIQITVSGDVICYADVALGVDYSRTVDIVPEPTSISAESLRLGFEETGSITVNVGPTGAVTGRRVTAISDNPFIAQVQNGNVIVDGSGNATFSIRGLLPGSTTITLSLDGTLLTTQVAAIVAMPTCIRLTLGYTPEVLGHITRSPRITSPSRHTATVGTFDTFQVTATGTPEPTFGLSGAPTGVTINPATGVLNIAGSTAAGMHTFIITASNGIGTNATQTFTLTISPSPFRRLDDVIVRATNDTEAFINLTAEAVYIPFTVAEYSVNGGRSWKRGTLPSGNAFSKLFNRELTLSVRSERNGGTRIDFPKINARPRSNAEKLRPWYGAETWSLMERAAKSNNIINPPDAPTLAYEWVQGDTSDGRIATNPEWYFMPSEHGFNIVTAEKGVRIAYFFRSAPIGENGVYTPASKPFRVRPAAFSKQLNLGVNYKTETVKTRIGQEYSTDGGGTWIPVPVNSETGKAILLDVSDFITEGNEILVRRGTTGRKTSTVTQVITPQPRAQLASSLPMELTVTNGKIDAQALRPYNVLITAANDTQRWRAVPRFNANNAGEYDIRMNPTAKRDRNAASGWSGNAASLTGTLTVEWGVVGKNSKGNDIMGVIRAVITEYGQTPPPILQAVPPRNDVDDTAEIIDTTTKAALQTSDDSDIAIEKVSHSEPADKEPTTEPTESAFEY